MRKMISRVMDILNSSVVDGTSSRLRPILMSSLTTILGVIPMAIASGEVQSYMHLLDK